MNQSTRNYLKANIYALSLREIVKGYVLDYSFVKKYILNSNYQLTDEDRLIDVNFILKYQPHLAESEIFKNDYDCDSIDDFQTISER